MKSSSWALIALMLLGSGCNRGTAPPVPRDTFVTTMVELRRAAAESAQDSAFEARRQAILERQGVSEADLHAYVRWAAREPGRLRDTFDQVTERLREPVEE